MLRRTRSITSQLGNSLLKPLETGLDLVFLGTSSAKATISRNTSCIAFHYDFGLYLFDCGEGTCRQLIRASNLNKGKINKVFITHLHGDHIYGLPGLIMQTLQNKEQLEVYAPAGIKELLGERLFVGRDVKLRQIHKKNSQLPRQPSDISPNADGTYTVYEDSNISIKAAHIMHSVFTLGYVLQERKKLKINAEKLTREYNFPPCYQYKELAEGKDIVHEGRTIRAADVTTKPHERKIVILGDTCNPSLIVPLAMNADVLVHEATCENNEAVTALKSFHSTSGMAGIFAQKIRAKQLILTHFSPRNFENLEAEEVATQRLVNEAQERCQGTLVTAAKDFFVFQVPRS